MKKVIIGVYLLMLVSFAGATKGIRIEPKNVYNVSGELVGSATWLEYTGVWSSDNCDAINLYFEMYADSSKSQRLRAGNRWSVPIQGSPVDSIAIIGVIEEELDVQIP